MRTRDVLWACVACGVAWLLALATWPRAGETAPRAEAGTIGLQIDPAAVTRVSVVTPDGGVVATRDGGAWVVGEAGDGGLDDGGDGDEWMGWPAVESAVRSAVRSVTAGTYREAPQAEAAVASIVFETPAGRATLELSDEAVGGLIAGRLVRVDGGPVGVLAPASLRTVMDGAVRGGWRSPALLGRIEPGPRRLAIEATADGAGGFVVERVGGRWRFVGSEARVDEAAVVELVNRVTSLRASGWLADVDGEPVATIALETIRPDGSTWTQRLEIVGQADLAGELVSVRASRVEGGGPGVSVGAAVAATGLDGLPSSPDALTDRRSVAALAAEVVEVSAGERRVTRDGRAWRTDDGVRLPASEAAEVDALIVLLTVQRGTIVARPRAQGAPGIEVSMRIGGDAEPRRLVVHPLPSAVVVWDGATARSYAADGLWGVR